MKSVAYYALLFDSDDKKLSRIIDQDIVNTPYDVFRRSTPVDNVVREGLRSSSFTTKSVAKLGDYIENVINWPLCSARFAQLVDTHCPGALELIDAPRIFDAAGHEELGAKVINTLISLPCLDLEKSTVAHRPDGTIRAVYEKWILPQHGIPADCHIFRPREWPPTIMISHQLARWLTEAKMRGVAFEPIESS